MIGLTKTIDNPAQLASLPAGKERLRPSRLWVLFGLFMVVYLLTLRGHMGSRDEEALYMTSVMLVKQTEDALGIAWTAREANDARSPAYNYEIGQPLAAIPFYLLGDRIAAFFPVPAHTYVTRLVITLFVVVVTAATVARLYGLGRLLGFGAGAATLSAVAYGLGTLAWPYSRTFFREPLVALALLSAVIAITHWRAAPTWGSSVAAWGWVLVATAAKLTTLVAVPVLLLYAASSPALRRSVSAWWAGRRHASELGVASPRPYPAIIGAAALFGLLVGLAWLVVAARWIELRGMIGMALSAMLGTSDASYVGMAMYGLTLAPGKGLVPFAPPVLAALAGLPLLARQHRAEAVLCVSLSALYIAFYSFSAGWHGGACWGPRYLVPVLPLLMLPVGLLGARLWEARRRAAAQVGLGLLGTVLILGGMVQLAAISIDPIHYYLDVISRQPVTLDTGPYYLREIHFDPALSPVTGHLRLAALYTGDLLARRTQFPPLPYDPVDVWQYFHYVKSLDLAWVHIYGWQNPSPSR